MKEVIEINDKVYGPEIEIEYEDKEEREQIIDILNSYRDIVPYGKNKDKRKIIKC